MTRHLSAVCSQTFEHRFIYLTIQGLLALGATTSKAQQPLSKVDVKTRQSKACSEKVVHRALKTHSMMIETVMVTDDGQSIGRDGVANVSLIFMSSLLDSFGCHGCRRPETAIRAAVV